MTFLSVNFETRETILDGIDMVADKIAKDIIIKINTSYYKPVDFEFYVSSEVLKDPHTYAHDLQLRRGKFYFHASGVDLTFGDGTSHGGILLRSVVKYTQDSSQTDGILKQQFKGPQIVATELLSNLDFGNNEILLIDVHEERNWLSACVVANVLKAKRIGLTPKKQDPEDDYINLRLRYIAVLPQSTSGFVQKIDAIESVLGECVIHGMEVEEAQRILGYKSNAITTAKARLGTSRQ